MVPQVRVDKWVPWSGSSLDKPKSATCASHIISAEYAHQRKRLTSCRHPTPHQSVNHYCNDLHVLLMTVNMMVMMSCPNWSALQGTSNTKQNPAGY
jgi:hypothetical protein